MEHIKHEAYLAHTERRFDDCKKLVKRKNELHIEREHLNNKSELAIFEYLNNELSRQNFIDLHG